MTIPDFQSLMLPVLKYAIAQNEHSLSEAVKVLENEFDLSEDERNARIPSGSQTIFYNRVGWARTYLKQAGLLETGGKRNLLRITDRGREVLGCNPSRIDMKYLEQFPEYMDFRERTKTGGEEPEPSTDGKLTPDESMDIAYRTLREKLAKELLENILKSSPKFFENLVVELLVAMGYGGSGSNAAKVIGQSGDEGVDGVIDEDKLGLDNIYIQAKKWTDKPVGREEIQKFVGALQGKRAHKGIFITASHFTDQAKNYASNIEMKVVLIDGKRLSDLMIDHNVGVTTEKKYELKRIDSDYFIETLE
jgi:restriction system protein